MTGLTKCTALDGRDFGITCTQIDIGNAHTNMGGPHTAGALQPNGTIAPEPTFDVAHVASTIVHIASLPPDVAMLEVNIMFVSCRFPVLFESLIATQGGRSAIRWQGVKFTTNCIPTLHEREQWKCVDYGHEGVAVELEAPTALGIFLSPCAICSRSAGLK